MGIISENSLLCLPKPKYDYITTEENARRALEIVSKYPIIGIDIEATGLDPFESKIVLVQVGLPNKAFVFDIRHDTEHSSLHLDVLKSTLTNKKQLKILQNAVYDMKMIKVAHNFYIENIYDPMLTEQLLGLGLWPKASLDHLVHKYLGLSMSKQPRDTFENYGQKFRNFQLEYAASDAIVLHDIRNCQLPFIKEHGLEDVCRLEFEFTKPMCEMELNGINLDVKKWRAIMEDVGVKKQETESIINNIFMPLQEQTTLFGVSLVDINSPQQLKKALIGFGLPLESTDNSDLSKYEGVEIIDAILGYRKHSKLISTYAESLIEKIHAKTGRLHTEFKQLVSTGRMSSAKPNLQNIPKEQMYRSCFVAGDGNVLVTSDQSSAEIRILGNLSKEPSFIKCFKEGIDLHTKTASEIFGVPMSKVTEKQRDAAKALNFGLCVSEDTKLITNVGVKEIKEIEVGEHVAHDINTNEVIDKKFMGEKEVFEIKTKYGYTVELTNEHIVKVIDINGKYIDKELRNVDIDRDYICIKKGSNLFNNNSYVFDEFSVEKNTNYKEFVLPEFLDEDWASFLGLFVAEGALIKAKNHRSNYGCVSFGFSTKNEDFIISIESLFSRLFNTRTSKTEIRGTNTVRYSINSILLSQWIYSLFNFVNFSEKSKYMHIPDCVKQSPKNIQISFLTWLLEGNGTIKKNNNSYTISYSSKSISLVKDIQLMLLNFGILSSVGYEKRKKYPGEKYYYLNIVSYDSKDTFMKNILKSFGSIKWKDKFTYDMVYNCLNYTAGVGDVSLERLKGRDLFFKFIDDNGVVPLPIKTIKSVGTKRVYDISVEKHPYFLANGFVVHNCYGLSQFGLARGLKISEKKAAAIINTYFSKYPQVKKYLDAVAKSAIYNRYSTSISGRRRFYRLPEYSDPNFNNVKRGVERQAKNMVIQASDADTIKKTMVYLVDRLIEGGCNAKLLLTVHDEVVVETKKEQQEEVSIIVEQAVLEGFNHYFSLIPMQTNVIIGPCWLKHGCKCGCNEMISVQTNDKYNTKIVCKECGKENN